MIRPCCPWLRLDDSGDFFVFGILQTVALDLLDGRLSFAQGSKRTHLIEGIFLADLAQGKTDMDEYPVSLDRQVILQEAQINLAPDSHDIDESGVWLLGKKLNDLSRYG
jgi:hypothetical protein